MSWGTKGDNKPGKLGSAKKKEKDDDAVEVELPFEDAKDKDTANAYYQRWLETLPNRPKEEAKIPDLATSLEDWYKNFRTQLVILWLATNGVLILIMTNPRLVDLFGGNDPNCT